MKEELLETRGTPCEPLQSGKLCTAIRAVERIPGNLYLRMEEKRAGRCEGERRISILKLTFGMKVVRNFGMSVCMQWYSEHRGCTVARDSEGGAKFLCVLSVGCSPASVSIAVELSTKPFGIEVPSFNALPISLGFSEPLCKEAPP